MLVLQIDEQGSYSGTSNETQRDIKTDVSIRFHEHSLTAKRQVVIADHPFLFFLVRKLEHDPNQPQPETPEVLSMQTYQQGLHLVMTMLSVLCLHWHTPRQSSEAHASSA